MQDSQFAPFLLTFTAGPMGVSAWLESWNLALPLFCVTVFFAAFMGLRTRSFRKAQRAKQRLAAERETLRRVEMERALQMLAGTQPGTHPE